jgi:hypothetical protein
MKNREMKKESAGKGFPCFGFAVPDSRLVSRQKWAIFARSILN